MPHNNPLKHKLGPLEVWQWATVGFGIGGMVLLLGRKKGSKEGVSPEQEEHLLGALRSTGGAGVGGESIPPPINQTPVTPAPGEVGPPGIPGTPGAPGSSAAEVAQELQPTLASFSRRIRGIEKEVHAPPKKKAPGTKQAKKKKLTAAQRKAKADAKAKKEGKQKAAKARGNHSAQTGKPNHSKPTPLSHRMPIHSGQQKNQQAAKRAQQQHAAALHRARVKHEQEKRAYERAQREAARRRRAGQKVTVASRRKHKH